MEKVKYTVEKAEYMQDGLFVDWKQVRLRDVLVEDGRFVIVRWVSENEMPFYPTKALISIFPSHKEGENCYHIRNGMAVFTDMKIPKEWIEKLL